jgi:hypothetical protein
MRRPLILAAIALTMQTPRALFAQDSATTPATVRSRPAVAVTLSGLLQVDARLVSQASDASGPVIRRAELIVEAAAPRGFSLRVQPDFGQGVVLVQDAFVRWASTPSDSTVVRVGRFRPLFGTERARSSSTLVFPERGLVNSFMPSRALGVDVRITRGGTVAQLGLFQPPVATSAHVVDTDGDIQRAPPAHQEALLRIERRLRSYAAGGNLRVHLGLLAGQASRRGVSAMQPARILTIGQQPVFEFRATGSDPVVSDGAHWRGDAGIESIGARVAWHVEAVEVEDGIRRQTTAHESVKSRGIGAAVTIVSGGRRGANYAVTPTAARGAFEWGLRMGALSVEKNAVQRFGEPGSATGARGGGVVLSWLASAVTRLALSYDVTRLDRAKQRVEHTVILRAQQMY